MTAELYCAAYCCCIVMLGLDCTTRDVLERVLFLHLMVILLLPQTALDASFLLTHEMVLLFECGKVHFQSRYPDE